MAWEFYIDFDDGFGERDITSLVLLETVVRRQTIWNDLAPQSNYLTFNIHRDATIIGKFLGSTVKEFKLRVLNNSAAYFKGIVRPNFSITSTTRPQPLAVEAVDYSAVWLKKRIDTTFLWKSYKVCDPSTPASSIVHQLLTLAGYTSSEWDLTSTTIDEVIPYFANLGGVDAPTYWDVLTKLLFEFGWVWSHGADGKFYLFDFLPTSATPVATLDNDNMVGSLEVTRSESEYEATEVKFWLQKTEQDQIVFSETRGGGSGIACGITVAVGDYYPEDADTTPAYAEYEFGEKEIVAVENPTVEMSAGLTQVTFTNNYKRAIVSYQNAGAAEVQLTRFDIRGDVTYKDQVVVAKRMPTTTEKIFKYEAEWIAGLADGETLADGLYQYYTRSALRYACRSRDEIAIGTIVTIIETNLNIGVTAIVVERIDMPLSGEYSYRLEGISAYSPAATTTTQSMPKKSTYGLGTGLVVIAPIGYAGFADIYVNPVAGNGCFSDINDAIDALSARGGGTILLVGGTFNGPTGATGDDQHIDLKPNVVLQLDAGTVVKGNRAGQYIIQCVGSAGIPYETYYYHGCGIKGPGKVVRGVASDYQFIYVYATEDFFIEGLTIDGALGGGIYMFTTRRTVVRHVTGLNGAYITSGSGRDTKIDACKMVGPVQYEDDLIVIANEQVAATITDCVVSDCDFGSMYPCGGIRCQNAVGGIVARNVVRNIRSLGQSAQWTFGITIWGSNNIVCIDNEVTEIRNPSTPGYCAGILVDESDAGYGQHLRIAGNRVADCDGYAIGIVAANGCVIEGNVAKDNGTRVDRGDCESTTAPMVRDETTPSLSNATFARQSGGEFGSYCYRATKTVAAGTPGEVKLVDSTSEVDLHGLLEDLTYEFSVRMKIPSGSILYSEVNVWIDAYVNGAWSRTAGNPANTYDAWQTVTVTKAVLVGATAIRFGIELESNAASGEYVDVDDVRLMPQGSGSDFDQHYYDLGTNQIIRGNSWETTAGCPKKVLEDIEIESNDGIEQLNVEAGEDDAFVTLPLAEQNRGRRIRIAKADEGAGRVVIGTKGNLLTGGDCEPETGWMDRGDCELTGNLIEKADCEGVTQPVLQSEAAVSLSNCTMVRSSAQAHGGTYSRLITKTVAAGTAAQAYIADGTATSDLHIFLPQEVVTFEAWIYIPSASGILGSEITLGILDYVGGWVTQEVAAANTYDVWQKVKVTRHIRSSSTGVLVGVRINSAAAINEYFYVDDIDCHRSFPCVRDEAYPYVPNNTLIFDHNETTLHAGARSYMLVKNVSAGTESDLYFAENANNTDGHSYECGTYTASVWVYIPTASGISASEITLELGDYVASWAWTVQAAAATYDAWQKITVTRTFRFNSTGRNLILRIASTAALNEFFYIDDVEMIGGSGPMCWGEAYNGTISADATWERQATRVYAGTYGMIFTKTIAAGTASYVDLSDSNLADEMHGLVAGRTYTFSMRVYVPTASGLDATEIYLRFYSRVGATWVIESKAAAATYDAWQLLTITVRVPMFATGTVLRLYVDSTAAINEYFYVDDVILSHAAVTTTVVEERPIGIAPHFELYTQHDWAVIESDGEAWKCAGTNAPEILFTDASTVAISAPVKSTWYNPASHGLQVGAGIWDVEFDVCVYGAFTGAQGVEVRAGLAPGTSVSFGSLVPGMNAYEYIAQPTAGAMAMMSGLNRRQRLRLEASGRLYMIIFTDSAGTITNLATQGTVHRTEIRARRVA